MSVEAGMNHIPETEGQQRSSGGYPESSGDSLGLQDTTASAGSSSERVGGTSAPPAPFPHTPGFLLDVRINVSVEVGRVQMPIRQVMELGPGTVIELQRGASEPVEIYANGRCIGRGEIVVVGEQFGVRITELGPT